MAFPDERGRELLDLPDAPRPDPDTPAPVRFLPEYDNVLLSHADRSRFGADERVTALFGERPIGLGAVLVDGRVQGAWHVGASGRQAGSRSDAAGPDRGSARASGAQRGRR